MEADLDTSDYNVIIRQCEEFWREGAAYKTFSFVCQTSSYDSDIGLYSNFFVCRHALGCMTEDPNTVSNTDNLVSWEVSASRDN